MANNILDLLNVIALIILGIGTLIQLLDTIGLFPAKIRNYLRLNRAKETIDLIGHTCESECAVAYARLLGRCD